MKSIHITETVLRDANQSLIATRMSFEQFAPILRSLDDAGYHSLECWGGATFDSCIRYLNEDPWDRLRNIKRIVKKTPLQMLLRGQNLLGYKHYPKQLEAMGADSICIKDMAGLIMPQTAYNLVKAIKSEVKLPVYLHSHSTNGLAEMAYLKAAEAGVDGIDCSISVFSSGTAQPATESMHYALEASGFSSGLNSSLLKEINDFFKPVKEHFLQSGELDPKVLTPQPEGLVYQIPGGMLSNMISQLKAQNSIDKLESVLEEVPRVREDLGFPPLVTPMSQMVGTQATVNVLTGERYKMILKEVKAYCRGEYGKAPGEINAELMSKALEGEKPITTRFADTLEPIFYKTKEELKDLTNSSEDVLSYILFPQIAETFIRNKKANPSSEELRRDSGGIIV